jgi:glycosyltransferase involved in cell wall biosynthesis
MHPASANLARDAALWQSPRSTVQPETKTREVRATRIRIVYVVWYEARLPLLESVCRRSDRARYDLSFILLNRGTPPLAPLLDSLGIPWIHVPFRRRAHIPRAARVIWRHCRDMSPHIVHTHFMNASLAGLTAAALARVPVRIHTRHHAGPFPWRQRRPWQELYDFYNNALSTTIIAPSSAVRTALVGRNRVRPEKVALLHHGFEVDAFDTVSDDRIRALRERHAIGDAHPVVGVLSRYEETKGIQYIVPAFERLLKTYPAALLLLAPARGKYAAQLAPAIARIPPRNRREIPFEDDAAALYKLLDVFVHVPTGVAMEGFGQVYIEAMAAGVPSVITRSGIADEVARDGENAVVVPHCDSDAIYRGMRAVLEDAALRGAIIRNARRDASAFTMRAMIDGLEAIYESALRTSEESHAGH